jgi:hypothetical protein
MRQYLPLATESETFAAEEYGLWAEVRGRNRADAGAQVTGCRVFSCVLPPVKRAVFVAEGRKNDLLRHQVKVYRRSQQGL